jgi:hypothetical protein
MAGDKFYLQVRNDNKDILDENYLGKLRYYNMFSLNNWEYNYSDNKFYEDYYKIEERKNDNEIRYSILDDKIIENIRNIYNNNKPITEIEEEAYIDMFYAINWIDKMLLKYKDINIHFVLFTLKD